MDSLVTGGRGHISTRPWQTKLAEVPLDRGCRYFILWLKMDMVRLSALRFDAENIGRRVTALRKIFEINQFH